MRNHGLFLSEGVRKNISLAMNLCQIIWEQIQTMGLCIGSCQEAKVILWLGLIFLIKDEAIIGKEEAVTDNSQDGGCVLILQFGQCSCFCLHSDIFTEWSYFVLIHHSHRVALSDVISTP